MTSANKEKLIYLSCGGTGGHMTPAAALAQELLTRGGYRVEVVSDERGFKYRDMFGAVPFHLVHSGTAGAGLSGKLRGAWNLARGMVGALKLVWKHKPAAVIGFGGYPSVPAVWAANMLGVPTILHEQNAIIGKANAFLAAKAKVIALSLPAVQGLSESEQERVVVTGNPVRKDIEAIRQQPYPGLSNTDKINVVVVGGSLGATVLSDIVPQALNALPADYRARLQIVQQCRESDLAHATQLYKEGDIDVTLVPFIEDMAGALSQSHLLICRSGASTVSEVTVAGRPAIFVPYPHHKDQQQKRNAEAIADQGGAWVMSESGFTVEALKTRMELIFQNLDILKNAAEKAKTCGLPNAVEKLADLVGDITAQ